MGDCHIIRFTWGQNVQGKLGIRSDEGEVDIHRSEERSAQNRGIIKKPTQASGFGPGKIEADQVFCNYSSTFVIDRTKRVWALGSTERGVSGTGRSNGELTEPTQVSLVNIRSLSLGASFCLSLDEQGRVFAWGLNNYGQLGGGSAFIEAEPVRVSFAADETIRSLTCGEYFAAALSAKGEVWTWGQGVSGQLGHGNKSDATMPKKIEGISKIDQIAAGDSHTVLLDQNGQVYVFGEGKDGQIGRGDEFESSAGYRTRPNLIEILSRNKIKITSIAAGGNHCLAIGVPTYN